MYGCNIGVVTLTGVAAPYSISEALVGIGVKGITYTALKEMGSGLVDDTKGYLSKPGFFTGKFTEEELKIIMEATEDVYKEILENDTLKNFFSSVPEEKN